MARKKTRTNPYATQVNAESDLRYGPQESALMMMLSTLKSDRDQALQVNSSTAQTVRNAATAARPEVAQAGSDYLAQLTAAKQSLGNPDTAAYAASGDPYKQALARDLAGAQVRAAETTHASSNELTQRGLDAQSGLVAADRAVTQRYGQQVGQIGQQAQSLQGEVGTFKQSRLAELFGGAAAQAHDDASKDADRYTALLAAGLNEDGTIRKGGPLDPDANGKTAALNAKDGPPSFAGIKGVKQASTEAQGAAVDAIAAAHSEVQDYLQAGLNRSEVADLLLHGAPAVSDHVDPKKLEQLTRANSRLPKSQQLPPAVLKAKATIAGKPAIQPIPAIYLSTALDLAVLGHISKKNVGRLHERGLVVKPLGPTRGSARTPGYVPAQGQ